MAAPTARTFYTTTVNRMGSSEVPGQVLDTSNRFGTPCPPVHPVFFSHFYGVGWNAVIVGLLSCILALIFLLTCLYYLAFRRRYKKDVFDNSAPVVVVDKAAAATIPVTCSSQTASTTIMNEPGKETKINTYSEQATGPIPAGEFVNGMSSVGNGHTNGLLANGNGDASELRLLQHEHH
ncbi:unnamed protein product [Adineta ricciae]|uniref:Uncharacterized protein n=1 Tax=Adineta ricciae TaxID=249248 RepID=A0A814HKX3_ADIRI|nr:unnamed protein product [Adineta ricciae]